MRPIFGGEGYAPLKLFELDKLDRGNRFRNEAIIRGLCTNAYLGREQSLCRVLGRYKMFVDSQDVGLSSHLLLDGYWEMWLTEVLFNTIKPGQKVVDIGANLGYFTMLMADLVGPSGKVLAFEVNPRIAALLAQSVAVNGFHDIIDVHTQALTDRDGAFKLVIPEREPKNGFLLPVAEGEQPGADDEIVQARRADSYAALADADIFKIDADGSEREIWAGMEAIFALGRPMTIFLEFAAARYPDPAAFVDDIIRHGFSLETVDIENGICATSRAEILSATPTIDMMLLLKR